MAKTTKAKKKSAAKAPTRRKAGKAAAKKRPAAKRAGKAAAKKATRKAPARKAAGKRPVKTTKKAAKTARKAAPTVVKAARPAAVKKVVAKAPAAKKAAPKATVAKKPVAKAAPKPVVKAAPARKAPALNRERRTVGDTPLPMPPSSLTPGHASSARSGGDELRVKLASHTGTGPALTAGDVDADWAAAETVGDEAPGGDNPTPDQDVVDEIGRALGVEYDDDEELQGGDEIASRDRDRWELDPASSDDFDER